MNVGIFGKPRSGKTTLEAKYIDDHFRRKKLFTKFPRICKFLSKIHLIKEPYTAIYINDRAFSFPGCLYYDVDTLGMWCPLPRSLVILTEAGVNMSNRETFNLSQYTERFFAYYGHLKVDLIYDSQADDVDIKLRNRTDYFYLIKKRGEWNPKSVVQRIDYGLDVDQETKQLVEQYSYERSPFWKLIYRLIGWRFTLKRKKYYKYFDSWHDDMVYPMRSPDDRIGYERVIAEQKNKRRGRVKR